MDIDEARALVRQTEREIERLLQELSDRTGLPVRRLGFDAGPGYYHVDIDVTV